MKQHPWPKHPKFAKSITYDQHAAIRELECRRANELERLRNDARDLRATISILKYDNLRLNAKGVHA